MARTVADDTPSPAALTSSDEGTGSPDAMYARTRAARMRETESRMAGIEPYHMPVRFDDELLHSDFARWSLGDSDD